MPLPPGPTAHPVVQMARWFRNPLPLMDEAHRRFGDAFSLRLAGMPAPLVVVSHPEVIKEVFALGPDQAHAGKANLVLKPFLGVHSLLLLDGAEHLRQRKMMLPAFHGERMHAYGRSMIELAHHSIDRWPIGQKFAVHGPMQEVTLQVIIRTVFGIAEGPRFAELADLLTRTLRVATRPGLLFAFMQRDLGPMSPWGRFKRLAARTSGLLRDEIRSARDKGTAGRNDVLAMMLDARDEAGRPLSEDEIHDELMTLLIAGHETTATSLAWALRWILPDAPLVQRLRQEIAGAGEDPQAIGKLELLDATVKESLRLQPIIPLVARILQEPFEFGGLRLPTGTLVTPSVYLVSRRPSLYPDPERFVPSRFLTFKPAPWEWLPFGGGLRRCIGAAFAMFEMKMVLASVLGRVDARLASDNVRVTRRAITLAPSGGLPVIVTSRRPREAVASRTAA